MWTGKGGRKKARQTDSKKRKVMQTEDRRKYKRRNREAVRRGKKMQTARQMQEDM